MPDNTDDSLKGPVFPPDPIGMSAQDAVNDAHVYDWYAEIRKTREAKKDDDA